MDSDSLQDNNSAPHPLVQMTCDACDFGKQAAGIAADAIATGHEHLFREVAEIERKLDDIDRNFDEEIVFAITNASVSEARELLACSKFIIDLERIGDLVSSFCSRAEAIRICIDQQDIEKFIKMATLLEHMLSQAQEALVRRDLREAIEVIRSDAEMDRLRNLVFLRHVGEQKDEADPPKESVQVLLMVQALERAGDHAKNLGEEVCHLVSGRTVRHVMRSQERPYEQLFLDC